MLGSMYTMFRLLGYGKPVPDKPNKARARATVQMQLSEFKTTFRGVLERVCKDGSQIDLIAPAIVKHHRFKGLGIKGKHQAPLINIHMPSALQDEIHNRIITLGHRISGVNVRDFKNGSSQLRLAEVNLKGRVGWDTALSNTNFSYNTHGQLDTTNTADNTSIDINAPACFASPCCGAWEISTHTNFQLCDLDKDRVHRMH